MAAFSTCVMAPAPPPPRPRPAPAAPTLSQPSCSITRDTWDIAVSNQDTDTGTLTMYKVQRVFRVLEGSAGNRCHRQVLLTRTLVWDKWWDTARVGTAQPRQLRSCLSVHYMCVVCFFQVWALTPLPDPRQVPREAVTAPLQHDPLERHCLAQGRRAPGVARVQVAAQHRPHATLRRRRVGATQA
jgi:hypothetical protein